MVSQFDKLWAAIGTPLALALVSMVVDAGGIEFLSSFLANTYVAPFATAIAVFFVPNKVA